jgi:hypothetical protein
MNKELLTVKELAAELRMSPKSIQRAYRSPCSGWGLTEGWVVWSISSNWSIWSVWMNERNKISAMAGGRYTYSARRWVSGQERELSESATEEERLNSLAKVHPKSGHRGRDRHHLAKRPSLIRR